MNTCSSCGVAFQESVRVNEHSARQTGSIVESISRDLRVVDRELNCMCVATFPDGLCGDDCGVILRLYVRRDGGGESGPVQDGTC